MTGGEKAGKRQEGFFASAQNDRRGKDRGEAREILRYAQNDGVGWERIHGEKGKAGGCADTDGVARHYLASADWPVCPCLAKGSKSVEEIGRASCRERV